MNMRKKDDNKRAFILKEFTLECQDKNYNLPKISDVGEVKAHSHNLGIFSSVEKAEKMIRDWLIHTKDWGDIILGFELIEKAIDEGLCGKFNEVCEFKTVRSYLPDGSLNCMSECDSSCEVEFRGRSTPVKCKKGDFVMTVYSGVARVGLVVDTPLTKDEWKHELNPDVAGDYTDDSYTTVEVGNGHDHPFSPEVFPIPWRLPMKLQKKLLREQKLYVTGKIL